MALEDNFALTLTWFYLHSMVSFSWNEMILFSYLFHIYFHIQWQYDNIEKFNSFHQCVTRLRFHFLLHSNELFPNKTSFTSNEQNISKGKAGKKKKKLVCLKKKKRTATIFDFKGISFSWGREMKIACSFYATWKKERQRRECHFSLAPKSRSYTVHNF